MLRRALIAGVTAALGLGLAMPSDAREAEKPPVRLATTTSTENSGLLAHLLPAFTAAHGYSVQVISVGTGKALKLGENGDVDAVLVHARAAEQAFVAQGFGTERREVMYNDFVLIGPSADPAAVRQAASVEQALRRIAANGARFVSRGDASGTHQRERLLWKEARSKPAAPWYLEAGQGMARVLQMASELDAYTLSDRGTWLAYEGRLDGIAILYEGGKKLVNPYGVIPVNPARHAHVNHAGASRLAEWLTSPDGQRRIGGFRVKGQQLFHPSAP